MLSGEIALINNHSYYYYYYTAESTDAMRIKSFAQEHNILMPGFEPSTSVSRNRHSNHMSNMLQQLLMYLSVISL